MSTFTYGPTDSVTISPNGDISITDGATTTTYSKGGATKTVTKTPPAPKPPPPETPVTQKKKGNGDIVHTYTDLSTEPAVTTKVTFHANGDVTIETTKGKDHTKIDINSTNGTRDTRTWTDPNPEPTNPTKSDTPTSTTPTPATPTTPGASAPAVPNPPAPVGSPTGGKKPKKPVKKPKKKPAKKGKRPARKGRRR